jgi:hypothetical protein
MNSRQFRVNIKKFMLPPPPILASRIAAAAYCCRVLAFQAQLKVALIHEISLKLNIKAACASFPR